VTCALPQALLPLSLQELEQAAFTLQHFFE